MIRMGKSIRHKWMDDLIFHSPTMKGVLKGYTYDSNGFILRKILILHKCGTTEQWRTAPDYDHDIDEMHNSSQLNLF